MSLRNKPLDSVTFADIEAFCLQKLPEGPTLDYKVEIPNDLGKLVAAFANTLGGLIVLGVKAHKTNNEPDWPPTGMPKVIGIEERITSICQDTIYPPVRPEISPIIDNPDGSGKVLAIIRVIESREAPHAVKGFVYERVGSQGRPYFFSQIDRIKHLLDRRQKIEEHRLDAVRRELERATRVLSTPRSFLSDKELLGTHAPYTDTAVLPLRWASVIPAYPWRDLCSPRDCYSMLDNFPFNTYSSRQHAPGGALAFRRSGVAPSVRSNEVGLNSISTKGHIFAIEVSTEPVTYLHKDKTRGMTGPYEMRIGLEYTERLMNQVIEAALEFYQKGATELPGFLRL